MFGLITKELRRHAPFTAIGAVSAIILMFVFRGISYKASRELFYVFHPLHVLLSALVTASMYRLHNCPRGSSKRCNLPLLFAVGYAGSLGIATVSDSIVPYLGEVLLNMPYRNIHIGFIEEWKLVNSVAVVGIILAYLNPSTKFPHAGHVLISTWASLFHVMMAIGENVSFFIYVAVFVFLFVAVWLPCCISDIVFPLLFVRDKNRCFTHRH